MTTTYHIRIITTLTMLHAQKSMARSQRLGFTSYVPSTSFELVPATTRPRITFWDVLACWRTGELASWRVARVARVCVSLAFEVVVVEMRWRCVFVCVGGGGEEVVWAGQPGAKLYQLKKYIRV